MDEVLDLVEPTDFEEIIPPEAEMTPPEAMEEPKVELLHETEVGKLLSQLVDTLEEPEKQVRELMVRVWKKHENYWRDRQYIIWDEIAQDWRTPQELSDENPSIDIDPAAYAKIINIYKAHGEAIISALSAGLPHVRFFPDDADSQDDVFTAKSYSKIAELLQKRNKGQLLFIRALFLLYNSGTIFSYNENKNTTEFGTKRIPKYENAKVITRQSFCPNCGQMLGSEQYDAPEEGETVQSANDFGEQAPQICPQCQSEVIPDTEDYDEVIPRLVGYSEEPKTHECIEVFGPLHVKVPHWIRTQAQTPYLTLETEEDEAMLQDIYPEAAEHIHSTGDLERYERYGRENSDYRGDTPRHLVTLRRTWIRPWAYNRLGLAAHKEDVALLKEKFPNGVYVVKANDVIVEAVEDKLDDHWTININPLSNHIHSDPLSQPVISVQDITNELTNLTLETVEFGIPETFYDSEAIDRDQYGKSEARPGMMYPAKMRTGQNLDGSFHTIKTATLSQEVDNFADRITQAGQFVSGAMPTIWGGALEGSGGTAKEVENARAMSLQRLNLTWIMVKMWWAETMAKSVRSFAVNMNGDERYVQAKGNNFINVWIRQAEMNGKVGQVEPDISEAFPVSWAQKRDIIMSLIALKNPMVDQVIAHPENAGVIAGVVGFPELYIPGDDARNKQLWEISQLLMAEPLPMGVPGPDGQEMLQSTIVAQKWEDHIVEGETCKAWLMSEVGIDCKMTNPAGYMNVVAHMEMHDMFGAQQAMAAQEAEQEQESDGDEGNNENA